MARFKFTNIDPRDIPRTVKAFNFTATDFAVGFVKTAILETTLKKYIQKDGDKPVLTSYLGTPVYDVLILGDIVNKDKNNYVNLAGNTVSFKPLRFVDCLIEVSLSKRFFKAETDGKSGTTKEYLGESDFQITISGTISSRYDFANNTWKRPEGFYPVDEAKVLQEICRAQNSISVASRFLNDVFGIENVVIDNFKMPQDEGRRKSQRFDITMSSDKLDNIILTEEDLRDNEKLSSLFK